MGRKKFLGRCFFFKKISFSSKYEKIFSVSRKLVFSFEKVAFWVNVRNFFFEWKNWVKIWKNWKSGKIFFV